MAKNEISRPATAHIPPFGLRMQPKLKDLIETSARASGRSMNAEITSILEAHYREMDRISQSIVAGDFEAEREALLQPARDEIARLDEEAKWLRQTLTDSNYIHKRMAETGKNQAGLLAIGLMKVLDSLPAPVRQKLDAEGLYQYAVGVRDDDVKAVVAGLKGIFGDAEDMREVLEEAQALVDAKERGDDLSGFSGANFDRMLAERDAGATPGSHKIDLAAVLRSGAGPAIEVDHLGRIQLSKGETIDPGPPPVAKHAPQPSPNARKRVPKKG